jgi:nickel-dependent lactate racemase
VSLSPVSIPYGGGDLGVPAGPFLLEVVEARSGADAVISERGIVAALEPLAEVVRGARRVLIVVSDATRATGGPVFLPVLVEAIRETSRAEIVFAVATGIHRAYSEADAGKVLGSELASRYEILRHDPDDPARLADVGRTAQGTRVLVNRALLEHDRIVLTGALGFHYHAGFSGGRKALVPGLAGRETVTRNHLRSLRPDGSRHPGARAGRLQGNPVHRDMVEGGAKVAPHFLVNTVLDPTGRIERIFAGDWRGAHLAGCRYLRATRSIELTPRDLVVASAGGEPADINLIQTHKAFEAAFAALRPGGVFVIVGRCREGIGHRDFLAALALGTEEAMVRSLREEFKVYAQTGLSWYRKARTCRLVLVSDLPEDQVRRLGAEPAPDLEAALALARAHLPERTRGWLFPHATRVHVEGHRVKTGRFA